MPSSPPYRFAAALAAWIALVGALVVLAVTVPSAPPDRSTPSALED